MLTFLTPEEIEKIEAEHLLNPEQRLAQKALAKEIITDLHGTEEYENAVKQAQALFSGSVKDLSSEFILNEFKDVNKISVKKGDKLLDILVNGQVCVSKREAREMISGNAISINGDKVADLEKTIVESDFIDNKVMLLKKGKKSYFLGILE